MTEIPEHIMEQAKNAIAEGGCVSCIDDMDCACFHAISEALLAAENSGKEEAARACDAYADRAEKAVPPAWEACAAARNLAAAIRGS